MSKHWLLTRIDKSGKERALCLEHFSDYNEASKKESEKILEWPTGKEKLLISDEDLIKLKQKTTSYDAV